MSQLDDSPREFAIKFSHDPLSLMSFKPRVYEPRLRIFNTFRGQMIDYNFHSIHYCFIIDEENTVATVLSRGTLTGYGK